MARLIAERAASFARGMNDVAAPIEYRPDEVKLLENGRPSFAGTAVARRGGSRHTHPTALEGGAPCWYAGEYVSAEGDRQIIAFFGSKAFISTDNGASWTDVTGDLELREDYYDTAMMRVGTDHLLILANGHTDILVWDGSELTTLANPFEGVRFVEVFNDRLYAAGHDGVNINASQVANPAVWDTTQGALQIRAQTHSGDHEIRGLFQIGTALLVFKRDSTSYVEGFGVSTIQVAAGARGISRSVGCVGFRTIRALSGRAAMWLSERGFEYFEPGGKIVLVSRTMDVVNRLAWANMAANPGIPCAVYVPRLFEYWCAVPRAGTANSMIYVFRDQGE